MERPLYVTLYKPGMGMGPAMHRRRANTLRRLSAIGLLNYLDYDRPTHTYLFEADGETYEATAAEITAYVMGMAAFYAALRRDVDEIVGDEALERLDDQYLDVLDASVRAVLPSGEAP